MRDAETKLFWTLAQGLRKARALGDRERINETTEDIRLVHDLTDCDLLRARCAEVIDPKLSSQAAQQ